MSITYRKNGPPASCVNVDMCGATNIFGFLVSKKGANRIMCPDCAAKVSEGDDECDECGGMGHTFGFEGPKRIKYPCETCGEA